MPRTKAPAPAAKPPKPTKLTAPPKASSKPPPPLVSPRSRIEHLAVPPRRKDATRTHRDADAIEETSDAGPTGSLSAEDQRFIARVVRFLVTIPSPSLLRLARREGYAARDHKEAWKLLRDAAGESRPLDLAPSDAGTPKEREAHLALLQQIDLFENTWFPRTRAIIRRVVPRAERDGFASAFFAGLDEQPLGPLVVGSVGKYLGRVDDLASSKLASAKKVIATLRSRGLSASRVSAMRALLAEAEHPSNSKAPKANAKEIARAEAAQLEALANLRDWFNDWSTTLRSVFGAADQIRLGITVVRDTTATSEQLANT